MTKQPLGEAVLYQCEGWGSVVDTRLGDKTAWLRRQRLFDLFQSWVTKRLREYLLKSITMSDNQLKNRDYFSERLRINYEPG